MGRTLETWFADWVSHLASNGYRKAMLESLPQLDDVATLEVLKRQGFYIADTFIDDEAALREVVLYAIQRFGDIVPGRFGQIIERVVPQTVEKSYESSLSAIYGTDPLPFHMDTAHHLIPARTLILACVNPGEIPAATYLIDKSQLRFSTEEIDLLRSAVFLVRTGRRSFYSSIMGTERPFLRFDLGCIQPIDLRGKDALHVVDRAISSASPLSIVWREGRILVVDNWRMLHARAEATSSRGRVLLRSCAK